MSDSKKETKEIAKIRDAAIFRALSTPHKPHKPLKKAGKNAAEPKTKRKPKE